MSALYYPKCAIRNASKESSNPPEGSTSFLSSLLQKIFLPIIPTSWRLVNLSVFLFEVICHFYIRKLHGSLMCLTYLFVMSSMDVFTTSRWQTAGQLVQELNVCTV